MIIFLSNFFTHHQKPFCDEMERLTNGHFMFVETMKMTEDRIRLGWGNISKPSYVHSMTDEYSMLIPMIDSADVVILGSAPRKILKKRTQEHKLTFEYSERLFKSRSRMLKIPIYYYHAFQVSGAFMLCASAYTSVDYNKLFLYRDKCYKWGYFPNMMEYNVESLLQKKEENRRKDITVSIVWVARFIGWKHPESVIELAKRLTVAGVRFDIQMIGTGPLETKISEQIVENGLSDCVHVLGSKPSEQVRSYMEDADICIFTSDRNEGWGAVLNESMNSACAVVASNEIGAVPFLIKDKENGLVFKSKNWDSLFAAVKYLIDNQDKRRIISKNAYNTIAVEWNAKNAAERLMILIEAIQNGNDSPFTEGPCSKA